MSEETIIPLKWGMASQMVKVLDIFSLAMINVAAVLSIRNFPSMAEYGWSSVGWYADQNYPLPHSYCPTGISSRFRLPLTGSVSAHVDTTWYTQVIGRGNPRWLFVVKHEEVIIRRPDEVGKLNSLATEIRK